MEHTDLKRLGRVDEPRGIKEFESRTRTYLRRQARSRRAEVNNPKTAYWDAKLDAVVSDSD
jgi:hypothetical protein